MSLNLKHAKDTIWTGLRQSYIHYQPPDIYNIYDQFISGQDVNSLLKWTVNIICDDKFLIALVDNMPIKNCRRVLLHFCYNWDINNNIIEIEYKYVL